MLSGKTQWRVMSTFWHKMSDLKSVCSINMWKLTEKSHFCALSVTFLRLVCILKLEGLLQGYVKWKNTMICALSVTFLRLVCILRLSWKAFFKAMLSGKTQWRVMSTFWHKMSDWNQFAQLICGNWPKKFLCLHFKVGRPSSRLC